MSVEHSTFRSEEARRAIFASYEELLKRWPVPLERSHLETHLGRAHGLVFGDVAKPPLVLLHGGGGNATMWLHNAADLARSFRVFALDLPGEAGQSEGARPSFSSGGHVRWLTEAIDQLGHERTYVAGASFGAWLAHRYSIAYPERIRGLCLFAPPHLHKLSLRVVARALLTTLWPSDQRLRAFFRYLSAPGAPELPEWALADWRIRWRGVGASPQPPVAESKELASLPSGAVVVLGAEDPLCDAQAARHRLSREAPQVEAVTLEDAGHILTVDRAAAVTPLLEKLL